jgi:hypothetical protein
MSEVGSPAVEFTVVSSSDASPFIQKDKELAEEEVKVDERNEVGESEAHSQAESSVAPDTTSTVKAIDEEMMDPEELDKFFAKEKVFLILTNSGKPVYCS